MKRIGQNKKKQHKKWIIIWIPITSKFPLNIFQKNKRQNLNFERYIKEGRTYTNCVKNRDSHETFCYFSRSRERTTGRTPERDGETVGGSRTSRTLPTGTNGESLPKGVPRGRDFRPVGPTLRQTKGRNVATQHLFSY